MSTAGSTTSHPLPPAVMARWIEELECATGRAALAPFFKLALLIIAPALAVGWTVVHVPRGPEFPALAVPSFLAVPLVLVFQSALAAVLLRFVLWLLGRYIHEPVGLAVSGALLWGMANAHSPAWGTHVVWPFYVTAAVFLRLQERSLHRAYSCVILLHAVFNLATFAPGLWEIFLG